jgi:hypothetical protein
MAAIACCQSVTGADGLHFAVLRVLVFLSVLCVKPLTLARKSKGLTQRTQRKEEGTEYFIFLGNIAIAGAELSCSIRVENRGD